MPSNDLTGLALTRSERIIVITLSYIFCAPLFYANGKRLWSYLRSTSEEARRQLREEDQDERRRERHQELVDLLRETEQAAAQTAEARRRLEELRAQLQAQ